MTRTSSRRRLPFAAVLALAALGLSLPARSASADVVRLRTGETIKGRVVVERSNEQILVIEDYLSGAIREIAWQAVDPQDADTLQTDKLFILDPDHAGGSIAIAGEVVTIRLTGGATAELRGIVESEAPAGITVLTRAGKHDITKDRIVSREKTEIDASDVYSPHQLYEMKVAEVNPQDARGHYRVAQYAERAGAYEDAKAEYEQAAADESFLNRDMATKKVEQLTALLKDQQALEDLRLLRETLSSGQFAKVRSGIEKFLETHPEVGEAVKKKLEDLKASFAKTRTTRMSKEAGDRFVKIAQKLIAAKVKPKDTAINDVLGWARKQLPDEAFDELLQALQHFDSAVTIEETKTFWEGRPKKPNGWKSARYGSGSFIVEPPKIKPPSNQGGGNRPQRGGGGGGPAPTIKIPSPPTRDTWWTDTKERPEWTLAYFVENSGLFEVAPKKEKSQCDLCGGAGLITKALSNGGQLSYLCNRCGGAQYDLTVKFR